MQSVKTLLMLLVFSCCNSVYAQAKEVHNKQFKFSITLPDKMEQVKDSSNPQQGDIYYDEEAGVILMISEQKSKFKTVKDYVDCSKEELETMLKSSYEDSTLHLISCNKSPYYPDRINLLIFDVNVLPSGFDRCVVYFVHHQKKDVQFSFMFNKKDAEKVMRYIDSIMKTLVLHSLIPAKQ